MLRSLYVFFLIFSTLPVILWKPHVGVLVWSWISYMNPHRLTYGIAYQFNFLDYVAAVALVSTLLAREPKSLPKHPLVWLLAAYFIWVTITSAFADAQTLAWDKWWNFTKVILFTFVTMMLMQTKERLHALLWVIVLSIGFFAMKGGLFTIMTAGANRVWGPPSTFFEDNNDFALACVMLVPLVRYMQTAVETKYLRWIMLASVFIGLFAIFGTQSRGALVGISSMLLFLVWKSKRFIFGIAAIGFAVAIGLVFMPDSWRERMSTIEKYQEDASAQGRLDMWKFAIDVAADHPIVGGGFDMFYNNKYRAIYLPEGTQGRAVHSLYFEVLGEHGYVGLILYLLIGITTFFTCGGIIQRTRDHPDIKWAGTLAAMIQVSLVGFASAGAFLTVATFDLYYHLVAVTAMLKVMVDRVLAGAVVKTGAEVVAATPATPYLAGKFGGLKR